MNPPTTPTKKGEGINRLVRSLNTSWRLRLPDRTAPISPSKVVNPDSRGEKIYRLICFLYFQRHEALMWACERFESHAQQQSTQWVYKPGAETDTLPSRQPSDSLLRPGPYIRVNGVYEPDVNALEETLLRFLNEAKDFQPSPIRRDSIPRSGLSLFPCYLTASNLTTKHRHRDTPGASPTVRGTTCTWPLALRLLSR